MATDFLPRRAVVTRERPKPALVTRTPRPDLRYLRLKRVIDVALTLLMLPLLAPIAVACVIAIAIESPGPIVFTQLRTGRDGRRFRMYKFRTMVRDAESRKAELMHLNILPAPDFKILEDPRITRVGRFLRTSSLDELPQLLNVLRGEMSLVGPRPTSFAPSTYSLWHTVRLDATPGITGLWQVKGRNQTTFDERLRLDVEYLRNASLWYDLLILIRTAAAVVRRSGS